MRFPHIRIWLRDQRLELLESPKKTRSYTVSTAKNGPGERMASECTPRGRHIIRAKIGEGLPSGAVLIGRRFTGEIYSSELARQHPGRDWILTRILWLSGVEPGLNRLGDVDTMRRCIYIHGAPDDAPLGVAASHGCIRMGNADVTDLFARVAPGTPVEIIEAGVEE